MASLDLGRMVERAANLEERLSGEFAPAVAPGDEKLVAARLEAWTEQAANGDARTFKRRLARERIAQRALAPLLGTVVGRTGVLPRWAQTLGMVLNHAPPEGAQAPALERLLRPFVTVASRELRARAESHAALFSPAAFDGLEQHLIQRLALMISPTVESRYRAYRARVTFEPVPAAVDQAEPAFNEFVGRLQLAALCEEYPALARLLATISDFWVDVGLELLRRLAADLPDLSAVFPGSDALQHVVHVSAGGSDPHCGGRTVVRLVFEQGTVLYYKPRPVTMEAAFSRLLEWLNERGAPLHFRVPTVLVRAGYGWMDAMEAAPIATAEELDRYYQRAGMLLRVASLLEGTDLHDENVVSAGEHPVLIDLETLFSPRDPRASALLGSGGRFSGGLHRTHFLPRLFVTPERIVFDLSPLSSALAERIAPELPDDDRARHVADGFRAMHVALQPLVGELLATDGPIRWFSDCPVRVVSRDTMSFGHLLRQSLQPRHLRHGVDRSIRLERLWRTVLEDSHPASVVARVRAEIQALEQGDIPYELMDALAAAPSHVQVRRHLRGLSHEPVGPQLEQIHFSIQLADMRTGNRNVPDAFYPEVDEPATPQQFIAAAHSIAERIKALAEREPGRAPLWSVAERIETTSGPLHTINPAGPDLHHGVSGIALFLAALEHLDGGGWGDLALEGLRPFLRELARPGFLREYGRHASLGSVIGIGSLVYALTRIGRFLDQPRLYQAARSAALQISPERIAGDNKHDLMKGSAGALVGLLALHETTGDDVLIERAQLCARHLLDSRTGPVGTRAWKVFGAAPWPGAAHGAAGIALALSRLFRVTGEPELLDAASEAMEFEATLLDPDAGDWCAHGSSREAPMFGAGWCNGATGMALSRLGSLATFDNDRIRSDIARGLVVAERRLDADYVCCGNAGRLETLVVAADRLQRPALLDSARRRATCLLADWEKQAGFRLRSNSPVSADDPGFFDGLAGIGYLFLRVARPLDLPSVLLWE